MSEYKGYTEQQKIATMKYMKESREKLGLNLPKGKKDEIKKQATAKGFKSATEYILFLIEQDK